MTAPFATAQLYRGKGWSGTLPLPAGRKSPPPDGYTGYDGIWPTTKQVEAWQANGYADGNLALRLPGAVVGLDIDAYADKPGGQTLAALIRQWGPLPPTWRSTARADDLSGIRLYRVPPDLDWPTEAGPGIEIIRYAHRYMVVWPSVHPEGGTYRWIRPDGTPALSEIPGLELPDLPAAWLAGLTGHGVEGEHVKPGSRAELREKGKQAGPWLAALPKGDPCRYVGRLAADLEAAATRQDGNAYDHTRDTVMALLRAGEIGHPGVLRVLDRGRAAYVQTVAATRGGAKVAEGEYDRFTAGGVVKLLADPAARAGSGCDCEPAILTINGRPIGEAASAPAEPLTWPEPEDRGAAVLSPLGGVAYVEDLIRPGRIVVVAAEEGTGKSYAISGELGIRLAVAGGSFAGTWPILRTGPVLVLSEMHGDDDYDREADILAALELTREALSGRYFRLALASAAGDQPALQVPEWREWITAWLRERGALLAVFDTATAAAQVDPWGGDIQAVYRGLRMMLEAYPELAIVLIVHLKKPQGRGERRISDVLGEWGRWCDVLLLLEADGLERVKLTARKRVRRERRISATKRGGLLVDPQELEGSGPKVPPADVLAAIAAEPGLSMQQLAARLGVSRSTARKYAEEVPGIELLPGKRGALTCHLSDGVNEGTDMSSPGDAVRDVSPVTPLYRKGVTDTSLVTSPDSSAGDLLQQVLDATGGELLA